MPTAKVTSKGQITLPKEVRQRLAVRPGDEVEFIEEKFGFRVQKRIEPGAFAKWRGYLKHLAGKDPDELVREMRGD